MIAAHQDRRARDVLGLGPQLPADAQPVQAVVPQGNHPADRRTAIAARRMSIPVRVQKAIHASVAEADERDEQEDERPP